MKKIDRLLLSSFIPPFFVAVMIAMFVLLMQTLWLYIDDIAGKGLGFFMVIELLAYKCVALIPLALPIAILISSVMVMGNLAEHYELSSLKSAGVRLLRIMRPLMFSGVVAGLFSYYCSNYLMPIANLKFGSRMYDIQRQKPTLRLDAGVFNYDFQGYAIHIGNKKGDDRSIRDILIYDHSANNSNEFSQIVAEKGEMYATEDGQYFVMHLQNGNQYVETRPGRSGDGKYPFVRTSFNEWNKVFDLSEFQLSRTDEELFKSNRSMLTISQLREATDSISLKIREREKSFSNHVSNYFGFMELDSTFLEPSRPDSSQYEPPEAADSLSADTADAARSTALADTIASPDSLTDTGRVMVNRPAGSDVKMKFIKPAPRPVAQRPSNVDSIVENRQREEAARKARTVARQFGGRILEQTDEPIDSIDRFIETFPVHEQRRLYSKAKTFTRSIQNQAEASIRFLEDLRESRVKHIYDLHTKYSMAVVCLIFIFVGAPMGAIVRKGGFGYPILVSIIFFMIFVILTIFCRKIAESFVLPAAAAGWIPNLILFPIGLTLTIKAMNDSKLLNTDRYWNFFNKLFRRKAKAEK